MKKRDALFGPELAFDISKNQNVVGGLILGQNGKFSRKRLRIGNTRYLS